MVSYQCHRMFKSWCYQLALVWSSANCPSCPGSSSVKLAQWPLLGKFKNMLTMNSEMHQVHIRTYKKKKGPHLLEEQADLQPMDLPHSLDYLHEDIPYTHNHWPYLPGERLSSSKHLTHSPISPHHTTPSGNHRPCLPEQVGHSPYSQIFCPFC